jgi:hypothetical protein
MLRGIAGVVCAMVTWVLVATIGNRILRMSWPEYAQVETAMTFTLGMLLARLVLGALSSLCAGLAVAWITNSNRLAARSLAGVLLAIFIPIHYSLWEKFPAWYHVVFLGSLVLIPLLAAALFPRRANRPHQEAGPTVGAGPAGL